MVLTATVKPTTTTATTSTRFDSFGSRASVGQWESGYTVVQHTTTRTHCRDYGFRAVPRPGAEPEGPSAGVGRCEFAYECVFYKLFL